MAKPSTGKTRTTTAHGPTASKKAFKAAPTVKPKPSSSSSAPTLTPREGKTVRTFPSATAAAAFKPSTTTPSYGKRKADEGAVAGKEEPEKARVPSTLLNTPEEIDFPRGGGTNLTQVEVKEAQLEGEKEARDEQAEEDLRDGTTAEGVEKSKTKRRKLERALQGAVKEKNLLPKDAFRVEHLNYKRLVPSTKVLAQIILVRALELVVSLPNQLLGHIPITSISTSYTARLEAAESDSEESNSDAEESDSESKSGRVGGVPGLDELFTEGMWVSAVVTKSHSSDSKAKLGGREGDENVRASRRIELSLEPEKVNEGIVKGDLKTGFTLTAEVNSVEDHGYILSMGLPSITAFLPFKDAKLLQPKRLEVGQLVATRIKDVSENGRTCNVTCGRGELIGSTLSNTTSISSILPSHLVSALVTATLSSGLNVKFFGYFDGSIDLFHLNNLDPEKDFKVGQKIKARVMWDSIGSTPKRFSLSLAPQVLNLSVAMVEEEGEREELVGRFPVGRTLESVKVVRLDDEWGLTCEIEEGDSKIVSFVHISRVTDDHLASIPKNGPWKVGTNHRARVIGYSAVDGLVQLSLQPTVLEQSFLRVSDVKVGEIIKGTIKRLSDTALFVSISGNVDGVVWPVHYSDIKLKHPEKKFKVGASVKAMIYSADPVKNRVVLTLKKQLITSELPIVASIEDAQVGVVTHGTVSKVMEKGVLVDFFGGMRALIPAGEAAEGFTSDLSRLFTVGKVIPVRLISVDPATSKIVASARQALASFDAPADLSSIEIGTVVSGTIAALHESNLILNLVPSAVKALMSYSTLARHRKVTVEVLRAELAKGQELEDLVVVSKNADKGFVIVGLVPSKATKSSTSAPEPAASGITFDNLIAGQVVAGRICGKVPTGLLVQLSKTIRGRVARTEVSDDYDLIEAGSLVIGTNVQCFVISVDKEYNRVDLSLRSSRLSKDVEVKDVLVKGPEDVKVGMKVRGFVKNIASQGLFVSLGGQVTARVLIKELFDEFVKEWQPRFAIGQMVEGKITAVDVANNKVELSLRKNAAIKESSLDYSDLRKGQMIRGVVKRVEAYGAFIRIDGSNISGLCHKSKVTDDEGTAWTEFVHENDAVKAVIIDINVETKKISLALKPSLFPEGVEDTEDEDDDEEDDDEDDDEDEDEEEVEQSAFQDESEDEDVEMEAPVASTSSLKKPKTATPLAVSTGFNWDGSDHVPIETSQEQADADSSSDEEEEVIAAPVSKKGLATLEDKTGDLASQAPTSLADFERLLLGSPNSSFLWIQFIAYYLGLSQLEKAREVGARALKTINFREEKEKLNVWVALLNLENSYGTEATLAAMFTEAAMSNDSKTVYLRLVDIYERTGKFEAEEELFQKLVKKFGQSSKAWTLFGQFYLTRGRAADARDLLPRSLKSLEKRKHVKTISKFAQLEFKLGDAERGRTIFEGIMDSYPKRLDLWMVYVDMEAREGAAGATRVRALFNRILVQRLSSKKGKSVFKKWLAFEQTHGDAAGKAIVLDKARTWRDTFMAAE